jgi:hypothetical protein
VIRGHLARAAAFSALLAATTSPLLHAQALIPARTLDRFQLQETKALADSVGGGSLYRYGDGSATRVTVFIYPIPRERLAAPLPALIGAKTAFIQGMADGVRRGWYDTYEVAEDASIAVQTPLGRVPGQAVLVAAAANQQVFAEAFYIFAINSSFVKIRATFPRSPEPPRLRRFVEELVSNLRAGAR